MLWEGRMPETSSGNGEFYSTSQNRAGSKGNLWSTLVASYYKERCDWATWSMLPMSASKASLSGSLALDLFASPGRSSEPLLSWFWAGHVTWWVSQYKPKGLPYFNSGERGIKPSFHLEQVVAFSNNRAAVLTIIWQVFLTTIFLQISFWKRGLQLEF